MLIDEEDMGMTLWRACQPDSLAGSPQITVLGSWFSTGAGGQQSASIDANEDIDVESCAYFLEVKFSQSTSDCTAGTDLRIQKARARWLRQISPAPATATFNDVPTSHLFFQHIEALVASGITSGCGGGSFCPSAPLTRGQMAVFLATALGLHWGDISQ